jgi:hypothetical protein
VFVTLGMVFVTPGVMLETRSARYLTPGMIFDSRYERLFYPRYDVCDSCGVYDARYCF